MLLLCLCLCLCLLVDWASIWNIPPLFFCVLSDYLSPLSILCIFVWLFHTGCSFFPMMNTFISFHSCLTNQYQSIPRTEWPTFTTTRWYWSAPLTILFWTFVDLCLNTMNIFLQDVHFCHKCNQNSGAVATADHLLPTVHY